MIELMIILEAYERASKGDRETIANVSKIVPNSWEAYMNARGTTGINILAIDIKQCS